MLDMLSMAAATVILLAGWWNVSRDIREIRRVRRKRRMEMEAVRARLMKARRGLKSVIPKGAHCSMESDGYRVKIDAADMELFYGRLTLFGWTIT